MSETMPEWTRRYPWIPQTEEEAALMCVGEDGRGIYDAVHEDALHAREAIEMWGCGVDVDGVRWRLTRAGVIRGDAPAPTSLRWAYPPIQDQGAMLRQVIAGGMASVEGAERLARRPAGVGWAQEWAPILCWSDECRLWRLLGRVVVEARRRGEMVAVLAQAGPMMPDRVDHRGRPLRGDR